MRWREIDGSKLIEKRFDIVTTSLTMLRDMICVNIAYKLGIWSAKRITRR